LFWIVIVLVVLLDQFTKYLALSSLAELQSVPVIPDIFHLTLVMNPGAAFSLLPDQTTFFVVVTALAVAAAVYFYYHAEPNTPLLRLGIAMLSGGALGNMIDRVRMGKVVDFFDFRVFPVFNVADCFISVGVVLICWELLKARPDLHSSGGEIRSGGGGEG